MICAVCQGDNLNIIKSPQRGDTCDIRTIYCNDCGAIFLTETKCSDIMYNGERIPLAIAKSSGLINELSESFINEKIKRHGLSKISKAATSSDKEKIHREPTIFDKNGY